MSDHRKGAEVRRLGVGARHPDVEVRRSAVVGARRMGAPGRLVVAGVRRLSEMAHLWDWREHRWAGQVRASDHLSPARDALQAVRDRAPPVCCRSPVH